MSKFKELVENLDRDGLDELRRSVVEEVNERRARYVIKIEHIQPGMTEEKRLEAMREIARVLREETE
jgi:hypothetical protein